MTPQPQSSFNSDPAQDHGQLSVDAAVDQAASGELQRLLDQGKDRGFLTYDEIHDSLGPEDADGAVDDLLEFFAQEGIEVLPKLIVGRDYSVPLHADERPADAVVKDVEMTDAEIAALEG